MNNEILHKHNLDLSYDSSEFTTLRQNNGNVGILMDLDLSKPTKRNSILSLVKKNLISAKKYKNRLNSRDYKQNNKIIMNNYDKVRSPFVYYF